MNADLLKIENLNAKIAGIAIILMAIVAGVGYGYAFNGFLLATINLLPSITCIPLRHC